MQDAVSLPLSAYIGGGARRCEAMGHQITFIVQTFERLRGKLVPTTKDVAPTAGGALKRAEAVAGRMPGAAALRVEANDDTGEVASILSTTYFPE